MIKCIGEPIRVEEQRIQGGKQQIQEETERVMDRNLT